MFLVKWPVTVDLWTCSCHGNCAEVIYILAVNIQSLLFVVEPSVLSTDTSDENFPLLVPLQVLHTRDTINL